MLDITILTILEGEKVIKETPEVNRILSKGSKHIISNIYAADLEEACCSYLR